MEICYCSLLEQCSKTWCATQPAGDKRNSALTCLCHCRYTTAQNLQWDLLHLPTESRGTQHWNSKLVTPCFTLCASGTSSLASKRKKEKKTCKKKILTGRLKNGYTTLQLHTYPYKESYVVSLSLRQNTCLGDSDATAYFLLERVYIKKGIGGSQERKDRSNVLCSSNFEEMPRKAVMKTWARGDLVTVQKHRLLLL